MDNPADREQQAYLDRLCEQVEAVSGAPPELLELFRRFPRHRFLSRLYLGDERTGRYRDEPVEVTPDCTDPVRLRAIYDDHALAVQVRHGVCLSSTSQPSLMARMILDADVRPGGRVLEIGTATGWNAALLEGLVGAAGRVVTIEIDPLLADAARARLAVNGCERVEVLCGNGYHGAPDHGLFDSILVTVACPHLAPAWLDQLAPGGTLLAPVALPDGSSPLARLRGAFEPAGEFRGLTWFVPVRGGSWQSWPAPLRPGTTPWLAAALAAPDRTSGWPWGCGFATMAHDFALYLTARRERRFVVADLADRGSRSRLQLGLGQADPPGLALIDGDALVAHGDPEPERRLRTIAEEFRAAGCPSMADWRLTWHGPAPFRLGPPGAPSLGLTTA